MNNEERLSVRKECEKFIIKDPKLRLNFQACSTVDQEWVLNYLSSGKGSFLMQYELDMIR